jgi:TP901 family phage tail tape measure protein
VNSFGQAAELAILLTLKDQVTGPLNNIDRSLSGLNTKTATVAGGMSKIGSGLALGAERLATAGVALGVAMVGIAVKATDAAKTYQAEMELLRSQTGATQTEVDSASKAVLSMAGSTATSADTLAAGLYHIESAGLRGSQALDMLKVAAAGAKTGGANLEDVTNALVGAWQSGVKGAGNMTEAMGTLNAIVGAGNMRMQDLTDAMGTGILATAKTFGASMSSVGASIATMTDEGIPATDAATRLRMTMSLLGAPTSKARDLFKSIGLSSTDLANAMRGPGGLTDAITELHDHMVKAKMIDASGNIDTAGAQFLSGAFGGGRSSAAIMTLVGNYDLLMKKQAAVTAGTQDFGASFAATQDTVAYKEASLAASFDALKITLGEKLLPVESNVLDALVQIVSDPAVTTGINSFGDSLAGMFSPDNIQGAEQFIRDVIPGIKDFATGILPPLVEGLKISGQAAKAAIDMFMALPQPLQAAIIAVIAGNKLTGGLVASGLGDLAKVALGQGANAVSGSGGGILGVQKVFVVNMPAGGLGGGLGGAAGAAEGLGATAVGAAEGGAVPGLIAAGTGVGMGGLALGGAIMIAGLAAGAALGAASRTVLGPAGPETSRYNPINGQALNQSPIPGMYGNGTELDSQTTAGRDTAATDAHLATVAALAATEALQSQTGSSHDTSGLDAHIAKVVTAHTVATSTAPIRGVPVPHTTAAETAAALKSVQSFFTSKPVVTVAGFSDLLNHRDTSATDLHNAAQSLSSAVATWRGASASLDSAAKELHDSRPPIPNVSVTVNTTVTGKDVAQTQTHSHWYTPGGGEVSM